MLGSVKTIYLLYDSPQKQQYLGRILWYLHGDCGIEWEESLLRDYFGAETLQECFAEIQRHYGLGIYLEGQH